MNAKLCLVTGANSGIGKGLAMLLAEAGHRVIACARTEAKAAEAREAILKKAPEAEVEILAADLGDPDSIRKAVETFQHRHQVLDVLCNIAGATFWQRGETAGGLELNFAVNHLGPFLLTHLLLDALKAAPQGRIINVAGEFHRKAKLDFGDLQWKKRAYSTMKAGSAAMLMRVMISGEWGRRLNGTGVTVHSFHPGAVRSGLLKSAPLLYRLLLGAVQIFFVTPRKGAETGYWLATAPEAISRNGLYFIRKRAVKTSKDAQNEQLARQLWEITTEATKIKQSV